MESAGTDRLPKIFADTRSLMRELEQLSSRLKPMDDRSRDAEAELVIKGK